MNKVLIGAARGSSEQDITTHWVENIDIICFDYDEMDDPDRPESDAIRPGPEVQIVGAAPKSIFLESAELRRRISRRPKGERACHPIDATSASPSRPEELNHLLAYLEQVLQNEDRSAARDALVVFERKLATLLGQSSAPPPREKVLETFEGTVDCIDGDVAYVTLRSEANGDVLYGEYSAALLSEKGIEEDGRFICKTIETSGGIRIDIEAVPDVDVTVEQARAIRDKINKVLPRHDAGIDY